MTLLTRHQENPHATPKMAASLDRPRSHRRLFRRLLEVYEDDATPGTLATARDSETMSVAEFAQRYLETRDELALRKMRGEQLTAREQLALRAMNLQLEETLPSPPRLPDEARELIEEVKRLRAR